MDKLPNCHKAVVQDEKLIKYLLNYNHSEGWSKAVFFGKFGFFLENFEELKKALLVLACEGIVEQMLEKTPFGTRITIIGKLVTPDGRNPAIKTSWFIDADDEEKIPRLITAVPLN